MVRIQVVLLVGGTRALIQAVQNSVQRLKPAVLVTCTLREAQTRAAELRPFAIVVPKELHEFDSTEFDCLARDVNAELIVVDDDGSSAPSNVQLVHERLAKALSRRRDR